VQEWVIIGAHLYALIHPRQRPATNPQRSRCFGPDPIPALDRSFLCLTDLRLPCGRIFFNASHSSRIAGKRGLSSI
jgi:hypothetical protein